MDWDRKERYVVGQLFTLTANMHRGGQIGYRVRPTPMERIGDTSEELRMVTPKIAR